MAAPWVELIGFGAAAGTTFSLVPQIVRIWKRRSAEDVSAGMFSFFSLGTLLWLVYGVLLRSRPMILANGISLLLALTVLLLKIKFTGRAGIEAGRAPVVRD